MKIGGAWKKQTKDGKTFLSVSITIPLFGNVNFAIFPNDKKEKDNHPDYNVVWGDKKQSQNSDNNPLNDDNIPF